MFGFAADLVRLSVNAARERAREKAREKIKATYRVDIPDKNILWQIVNTAKLACDGNLDMTIRTQQVRDILVVRHEHRAVHCRPSATVKPTTPAQSGGSLSVERRQPDRPGRIHSLDRTNFDDDGEGLLRRGTSLQRPCAWCANQRRFPTP